MDWSRHEFVWHIHRNYIQKKYTFDKSSYLLLMEAKLNNSNVDDKDIDNNDKVVWIVTWIVLILS